MAVKTNDEIWADYNLDGSVHEPAKQDIRRKMNAIEALATAAGVGAAHYPTKAAMDADALQDNGTAGVIYSDPVDANNFPAVWVWNDAGNVWVLSVDRIGNMENRVGQSVAAVDGLYLATGAPRPIAWLDTSSYEVCWLAALTSPTTRFTATPTAAGLTIVGLGAMPGVQPICIRLPTDIFPGDVHTIEGVFSAGTISGNSGLTFGVDTATSGNLSTNARMIVRRSTLLAPSLANGTSGDGARTVTPAFTGVAFANGTVVRLVAEIQADYSLLCKVFHDGLQIATDVVIECAQDGSELPLHGRVIVGVTLAAGQTVTLTRVARSTVPAAVLWAHSGVRSSGDGTRGAPLKSLNDIPGAMTAQGLIGKPITINCLTDNVFGYLEMKDSLSPRWTINGLPGGNTALNGYNAGETVTWTVVPGTSNKVWSTPTKRGQEVRSHPNQPFLLNWAWNPRPWYTFHSTCVPFTTTGNAGVDMAGKTAGAYANSAGVLYLRLPDGMPNVDPNTYPIFVDPAHTNPGDPQYAILVSRTQNVLSVVGSPEVICNNITLRWASAPTFLGGAGFGRFTGCRFEWSGSNAPGTEVQNGQYVFEGCKWKYSDGDCYGRQIRTDVPSQAGSTLVDRLIHCELSHTGRQEISPGVFLGGDALSVHIVEDGTNRNLQVYMTDCWTHDTWKCGVPCNADLMVIDGCIIERFGTEGIVLFGVTGASAHGRTQRAFIRNTRVDPNSNGSKGLLCSYTDGMALCEMQIDNVWIGTPGSGGAELSVAAVALSGETRDITKNRIVYRNVTTERASGSVVKDGSGVSGTYVSVAANLLP
jgi:hypothetical protein